MALSPRAHEAVKNRQGKPTSWYLDLALIANYWGGDHVYHHTAPVSMILGLREALRITLEEGLEARFQRHHRNAKALWAGLEALGMKLVAPQEYRLAQITPVWIPDGVDDAEVRGILLHEYKIEIGRGLGDFAGKVWRIGLMGESSKPEYVMAFLAALEDILPRAGYEVPRGAGVAAASQDLAGNKTTPRPYEAAAPRRTRIPSPTLIVPPCATVASIPRRPSSSCCNPGRISSIREQGAQRSVICKTTSSPRASLCPSGIDASSMPEVVMFSRTSAWARPKASRDSSSISNTCRATRTS